MGKNRYLLHAGFSLKDNGSRYMKWTQPPRSLAFGKTLKWPGSYRKKALQTLK